MNPENFLIAQSQMISQEMILALKIPLFLIPNWKWLALSIAILGGLASRPFIQWSITKTKRTLLKQDEDSRSFFYHFLETSFERSFSWIFISIIWMLMLHALDLPPRGETYLSHILVILIGFYGIRLSYNTVEATGNVLRDFSNKTVSTMDDMLAPFITKTLKVLVVIFGSLIILQNLGINVVSLLAGLGLGGLALALAAQDTAANLFGSITIFLDQPFRIGDHIKVQDVEGTVEEIGFRSTRIRTFYNSVIAIPNSVIAKEKVDNLGVRPRRRVRHILGVTYNTPSGVIDSFCDGVKYILLQEPKVMKENISVAFNGYGDSALNILVNFHLEVVEQEEELKLQQKILCDILNLAKEAGVEFAYPTRSLYLQNNPAGVPSSNISTVPTSPTPERNL